MILLIGFAFALVVLVIGGVIHATGWPDEGHEEERGEDCELPAGEEALNYPSEIGDRGQIDIAHHACPDPSDFNQTKRKTHEHEPRIPRRAEVAPRQ